MNIFWFRRDLRLSDNAGLYHALKSGKKVQCLFIFDKLILEKLENKSDPRVIFIHEQLKKLNQELGKYHSSLLIIYDTPLEAWKKIIAKYKFKEVFTNMDYEPYAIRRDKQIETLLTAHGIAFSKFKDHIIFHCDEILKKDNTPYTVFTPYKRKWLMLLNANKKAKTSFYLSSYQNSKYFDNFKRDKIFEVPSLSELGFIEKKLEFPPIEVARKKIKEYGDTRDFPAADGTSKLGIHFRFGTISIREKARRANLLNQTFLSELIWRDFYAQILFHFPYVKDRPFRKKYEKIEWRSNENEFKNWCNGKTGYPIVDAGMRELNATGYMHNRVRMIVASFLTKHLLLDYKLGEAYFAEKLLDFDLASNNGGWQWAAGCGTDAAPYFRIFNPYTQQKRFDKDFIYIKKWIPEFKLLGNYLEPIVDHKFARQRCLDSYKKALNNI